jgi:hypothetical protein
MTISDTHYAQAAEWNLRLVRTCPDTERAAQLEAQARLLLKMAGRCDDKPEPSPRHRVD